MLEIGSRIILKPDYDKWFVGPSYVYEDWFNAHAENSTALFRKINLYSYSNRINILGLGDSFTFASGVYNIDNTHLALLETKLNASSIPVVVNNVAIRLAIYRHVGPECVAGNRTEVQLTTRSRQCLGDRAFAVAD